MTDAELIKKARNISASLSFNDSINQAQAKRVIIELCAHIESLKTYKPRCMCYEDSVALSFKA